MCTSSVRNGEVVFDENDPVETGTESWPLDRGEYVAILIKGVNPSGHYMAAAVSDEFAVRNSNCNNYH